MTTLPPWPKTCPCGEVWARTEWPELPPIGRYDAGSDGWIEVRTCVCGRSLATADADLGLEGGAEPPASDRVARTAVCP